MLTPVDAFPPVWKNAVVPLHLIAMEVYSYHKPLLPTTLHTATITRMQSKARDHPAGPDWSRVLLCQHILLVLAFNSTSRQARDNTFLEDQHDNRERNSHNDRGGSNFAPWNSMFASEA